MTQGVSVVSVEASAGVGPPLPPPHETPLAPKKIPAQTSSDKGTRNHLLLPRTILPAFSPITAVAPPDLPERARESLTIASATSQGSTLPAAQAAILDGETCCQTSGVMMAIRCEGMSSRWRVWGFRSCCPRNLVGSLVDGRIAGLKLHFARESVLVRERRCGRRLGEEGSGGTGMRNPDFPAQECCSGDGAAPELLNPDSLPRFVEGLDQRLAHAEGDSFGEDVTDSGDGYLGGTSIPRRALGYRHHRCERVLAPESVGFGQGFAPAAALDREPGGIEDSRGLLGHSGRVLVEMSGFEPPASALRKQRSTN